MSTNPTSFRFPFKLPADIHPQVDAAIRYSFNGLKDLNDAVKQLNTKVEAGIPAATAAAPTTVIVSGGSTGPTFGPVNPQPNLTPDAYTLAQSDLAGLVLINDTNPFALTLNSGLTLPFFTNVYNIGAGTVTATPSTGQVNSAANFTLATGHWAIVFFDGTNWWALIH